jgi:hypothetical protein
VWWGYELINPLEHVVIGVSAENCNFSHKFMGSRASIVSGRGKQAGAWAVGPRPVNKVKGGMWGYGWWCWVVCGVWVLLCGG